MVTARLVLPQYRGRQGQIHETNYASSVQGRNFILGCHESLGAGIHSGKN